MRKCEFYSNFRLYKAAKISVKITEHFEQYSVLEIALYKVPNINIDRL